MTCVRKADRPGVSASRDAHLMYPITCKHALIGAASIQALPLSACLAHRGRFSHISPEEAISFGSLYERANVSC
jgi:hypothetical protein